MSSNINYVAVVQRATDAANAAGRAWVETAVTWFPCGNAHVYVSDRRSRHAKAMLKQGLARASGRTCVEINHMFRGRQEYYLQRACAEAALKVLKEAGIDCVDLWEYID